METGAVKAWLEDRGFGFITAETDGKDVFVHVKSLPRGVKSLDVGALVQFDRLETQRGIQATNVMMQLEIEPELPQVWVLTEEQFLWELDNRLALADGQKMMLAQLAREHGWIT